MTAHYPTPMHESCAMTNSPDTIPVFYDPRMVVENAESYSPSAGKPRHVVASWVARGFPMDMRPVTPVTTQQLALAHDPSFVNDILACCIDNGFGNRLAAVAASLPWTSGAMLCAARHALETRRVACAPCAGFHHAGWKSAEDYCTFNGLMVTAMTLLAEGCVKRVGILDADQHYGNGTDDIIVRLNAGDRVRQVSFGEEYFCPSQADDFLRQLSRVTAVFGDCDVLLYQAGADPHVKDPLGGWLTTAQLRERDRIVFSTCRRIGLPVAWNLAGGYQRDANRTIRPVLDIHDNTMAECVAAYAVNTGP